MARCTVERLMRKLGLQGVVRGRKFKTTTQAETSTATAGPRESEFTATRPNQLWVADLTYVATWQGLRLRRVRDRRVLRVASWAGGSPRSLRTDLALDALEQAL